VQVSKILNPAASSRVNFRATLALEPPRTPGTKQTLDRMQQKHKKPRISDGAPVVFD
jgi:hypothetical protein